MSDSHCGGSAELLLACGDEEFVFSVLLEFSRAAMAPVALASRRFSSVVCSGVSSGTISKICSSVKANKSSARLAPFNCAELLNSTNCPIAAITSLSLQQKHSAPRYSQAQQHSLPSPVNAPQHALAHWQTQQ